MKEAIIKYNDAKTFEVLKELAKYFDFSIAESKTVVKEKKKATFSALEIDTRGYKFNRDEANER